jgi:hypothetical protein
MGEHGSGSGADLAAVRVLEVRSSAVGNTIACYDGVGQRGIRFEEEGILVTQNVLYDCNPALDLVAGAQVSTPNVSVDR